MEVIMMRRTLLLGAALLLVATGASAQGTAAPKVKQAGEIRYLSGGVGKPEREQLHALEKDFNLKLVLVVADGRYLASVKVVLSDAKGRQLVEHVTDGPFFLARLPAGEYTIAATHAGKTQTRKVAVAAGRLRTEHLRWSGASK
jgi:hypothetical protein